MKKFIYVIITVLILSIGLSVTSFATATPLNPNPEKGELPVVTFSDDFKTLYYNGYEYVQKDLSMFLSNVGMDYEIEYYEDYDDVISTDDYLSPEWAEYELTEEQKKIVNSVEIYGDDIILNISIDYKDGTYYSFAVLRSDYIDDYEKLLESKGDIYSVDFEYPLNNIVDIDCDILFENEPININPNSFPVYEDQYEMYIHSSDRKLSYNPGMLIILGNDYYYLDYQENNLSEYVDFYEFYYNENGFNAYPITDEATIAAIDEAEQLYYGDDYGYLYNDELADSISYFFLIMLFGVIPGFICVLSFIFAIIKKRTYRKLLFGVSAFSLAEIITFITFIIVANVK